MSNVCQLMAARWLACSMVVVLADCAMAALPATTVPPVGCAFAAGCAQAGSGDNGSTNASTATNGNSAPRNDRGIAQRNGLRRTAPFLP